MQTLKSEKGSTLMLVLITVSILTMLGTALLAMSFMNINMKQGDYQIKRSKYYAESGIDQVYARVGWLVEQAIDEAITATDLELQLILDDVLAIQEDETLPINSYMKADRTLDSEKLADEAEILYKENFRDQINTYQTDGTLATELTTPLDPADNYQYLDSNDGSNGSDLTITYGSVVPFPASGPDYEFVIEDVTSTFLLADHTEKSISTDIVISDEIAAYPLSTLEERVVLADNPLWHKPLVAHENIEFGANAVLVEGDVYGYGLVPANTDLALSSDFGGVIVTNDGTTTVNGNIYSRSYIQLGLGTAGNYNSGKLIVNNGKLYANSLVIQKYASGEINVNNGDVYTSDDLEMNGTGSSKILIDGSYYGYSDGSVGGAVTHDLSSAIVLNSDMDTAILDINGAALTDPDYSEAQNGILIGGTGYVDTYQSNGSSSKRFQTGESVAFKGNYLAYTWAFDTVTVVDEIVNTGAFLNTSANYPFYAAAGYATQVRNFLQRENVDFQPYYNDGASSYVNFATGSLNTGTYTMADRMAYFVAFKKYVNDLAGFNYIKSGSAATVDLDNIIYAPGLIVDGGGDFVFDPSGFPDFQTLSPKIIDDNLYQLHKMTYRNGADVATVENVGDTALGDPPTVNNINVYKKYTNLDINSYNFMEITSGETSIIDGSSASEIRHISDSGSELHLYGPGSVNPGEDDTHKTITTTMLQGIILRKGDIHIHGNIDFAGSIITEGSIYTHNGSSNASQRFRNNTTTIERYLANLIFFDDRFYVTFDVSHYGNDTTVGVNLGDVEFVEITPSITYDTNNNNTFTYDGLIHFEHWKVVK